MNKHTYESCFASQIYDFIRYRKASGQWNESGYGQNLYIFDRYCLRNYPDEKQLTQEMIDSWCRKKETETPRSHTARCMGIRVFVKYLVERNLTDVVPPELSKKSRYKKIPHAFTQDELRLFFEACDSLPEPQKTRKVLTRNITLPVFFRLLYSSGIRTTEARLLRTEDVNLTNGVLNIRHSKGPDQHYVVLHDSMLGLMQRYDRAIRKWYPERTYFFPSMGDQPYKKCWLAKNFREIWGSIFPDSKAVPYEFRHNYATQNLNQWIGEGLAFNDKFFYLSRSMGHRDLESTRYYYSLIPALADILQEKTEAGFNELVPEVEE